MDKENDFATLFAEESGNMTEDVVETENLQEIEEVSEPGTEELETNVEEEVVEETETEDESEKPEINEKPKKDVDEKTFEKMAAMRVELKKIQDEDRLSKQKLERFEKVAKELSFENVDELLEKTEEQLISKQASATGRSVEDIKKDIERDRRIAELENEINEAKQSKIDEKYSENVTDFVSVNKLSEDEVKKIETQLSEDGFDITMLKSMDGKPLRRLLESYLPKSSVKQKALEEKIKIKKEIPLDQDSNQNDVEEDEEVEKLYKQLNGSKN